MLKISDLKVNYGYVKALKGVSLEVKEGSIVTILGANGAGKSTTLKSISGIVPATEGEIEFMGQSIKKLSPEEIVSLGVVQCPEGRRIFPQFSVEENLRIGAFGRRKNIKNINDDYERVYDYFPKLKERKDQVAGTLSGGEQQMLAIARGLMANPKIFLLDEPSLGLAPIVVKEIFGIIEDINKAGVTILLVEQNAFQASKIADYVYVIETGNIVISGTKEEVISNENIKKSYLGA
ncbi:ABC transporter ATP-binding protein [Sporanaerobacter acetigenes]|uniref:Branched-chain amino acid transport system ATP-binding protein n=1 Tax=Sporanaerobacter acetigenes DSM 13106 TaxID=1123281 RepID=A0A1M5VZI0_9FIRM|nr:ABC transporter ATP-binding protein [Sporanaerobacter acetigenes]SHH80666.1 branched-chain amino acid transport system ATP-binding protein [Sporanaerobacter acetigenes DSM 13106]